MSKDTEFGIESAHRGVMGRNMGVEGQAGIPLRQGKEFGLTHLFAGFAREGTPALLGGQFLL